MSRAGEGGKESIVLGRGRLRCPHCEEEGTLLGDFKALEVNAKYKGDLNPVYRHTACGHVFSPGDPWIIQAFLTGELVPRVALEALQRTVDELTSLLQREGRSAA